MKLKDLYKIPDKTVITAHRGLSGLYPENTMTAFEKAVETGVDIVEFDVRLSSDGVPVILHDATLDRTTDGKGPVSSLGISELQKLNASYWRGTHDEGTRTEKPILENIRIPVFEDVLRNISGKVFLNIQVYCGDTGEGREKIAGLYKKYNLYGRAFLMLRTFSEAEFYRQIDKNLDICVGEDRGNLQRHKDFGLEFVQPRKPLVNKDFCEQISRLGLCANMFFANSAEEAGEYIEMGMKGIMTDNPHLMPALRK